MSTTIRQDALTSAADGFRRDPRRFIATKRNDFIGQYGRLRRVFKKILSFISTSLHARALNELGEAGVA
jgi:uncharacterized protein (UPF0276 family)